MADTINTKPENNKVILSNPGAKSEPDKKEPKTIKVGFSGKLVRIDN